MDRYLRVTHPSATEAETSVRLACVKHAASVRSEPGSNSQVHLKPGQNPTINERDLDQTSNTTLHKKCRKNIKHVYAYLEDMQTTLPMRRVSQVTKPNQHNTPKPQPSLLPVKAVAERRQRIPSIPYAIFKEQSENRLQCDDTSHFQTACCRIGPEGRRPNRLSSSQ
jgi:hypothetical protein